MDNEYAGVTTRFLRQDERLVLSAETEMPLVIEAQESTSIAFFNQFLSTNSDQLLADITRFGAVLLRGFEVHSDKDFENAMLSIRGLQGISDAFMSEEGRIPAEGCQFILHTNAVYKTGGTLYLGGFHSENYYSTDVPCYISFCCLTPSALGGETGLVNMTKVYDHLTAELKLRLEKNAFFVRKWLVSEVAKRYHLPAEAVINIAHQVGLPVIGRSSKQFILLYKPSVFIHPETKKKALQINQFEVIGLNEVLRKLFIKDYPGNTWFWHRVVWRLPRGVLKGLEIIYLMFASFFYSPKESLNILRTKIQTYIASKFHKKGKLPEFNAEKVGDCFNKKDIKTLAKLMRTYYCSCLWQKGDILVVDNRQIAHAGMPGAGPRLIRAMICNPLEMQYFPTESGILDCKNRTTDTVASYMTTGDFNQKNPRNGYTDQKHCSPETTI